MSTALQSQVDHIRDDGTGFFSPSFFAPDYFATGTQTRRTFCDFEDKRAPEFLRFVQEGGIQITSSLPDPFTGIFADRRATIPFHNRDLKDPELDTSAALPFVVGNLGDQIIARLRDLDHGVTRDELAGVISKLSGRLQIDVSGIDGDVFKNPLPRLKIKDRFPAVDLSRAREADPGVRMVLGPVRKVPVYKVREIPGVLCDYGAFRRNLTGTFALPTVYRGTGQVVPPGEYSLQEDPPGFYVVRFAREQRDGNGPVSVWVDVSCDELSNPADAIRLLMQDSVYGLGLSCDPTAFAAAAAIYTSLGYQLAGGLWYRRPAQDLFPWLLLHSARFDRNSNHQYTLTVDMPSLYPVSEIQLGLGDVKPLYDWLNLSALDPDMESRAQTRVKRYVLNSIPDWGFGQASEPQYLATTDAVVFAGNGIDKEEQHEFLTLATLKKEARWRAWNAAKDVAHTVTGTQELMQIPLTGRTKLYAPGDKIFGDDVFVQSKTSGAGPVTFGLLPWHDIDAEDEATCTPAPEASYLTDYRFTPPDEPTGLSLVEIVIRPGPGGRDEVWGKVTGNANLTNNTDLVWRARIVGQDSVFSEAISDVTPGDIGVLNELRLPPGENVQISLRARNRTNDPAYQDAIPAVLNQIIQVPHLETGPPSNVPINLSIISTEMSDGSRTDKIQAVYIQGLKLADGFELYFQDTLTAVPTGNRQDLGIAAVIEYVKSWSQDQDASYGILVYRETRNGRERGPLQQIPGWQVIGAESPNYTGDIDGTSAVSIRLGTETNISEGSLVDGAPVSLPANTWTTIIDVSDIVVPAEAVDAQVQIQGNLVFRYKTDDELNQLRWRVLRAGVPKYTAAGRTVIKTGGTFRTEDMYVMLAHDSAVPPGTYTYTVQCYFDTNMGTSNYVGELKFPSFATYTVKSL